MKTFCYVLIVTVALLFTGCVQTHYAWQNYDQKLYNHYKNPAEYEHFVEDLKEIIADGEESGKVPPGIYAEYGYVLYEKGNYTEAINNFRKEHDKWPESQALMLKMIGNAQKRSQKTTNQNNTTAAVPAQAQEVSK